MQEATYQDPTMYMGVHGVFTLNPWLREAYDEGDFHDVFSLAVMRATAYGFDDCSSAGPMHTRWAHNDAIEDWTQDGRAREAAWIQVAVPEDLEGQRLPVQPLATVLNEALGRAGRFAFTGLHTLVPMHLAPDGQIALATVREWFSLARPDASVQFTVSLSSRADVDLPGLTSFIVPAVGLFTDEHMTIEPADAIDHSALDHELNSRTHTTGLRFGSAFRCQAREWSMDVAVWATELFVNALKAAEVTAPVHIAVDAEPPSS
ncbi:hypothetical protein ACQEU3_11800 [Spirillospora sp. CA-253888]